MIGFSDNVLSLRPSATVQVADYASDLRRQGQSIISLAAGEPHFKTPLHIQSAAVDAIQSGRTKYTQSDGLHELRAAISETLVKYFLPYSHNNVIVSAGAKQVIFNAFMATLKPRDEVAILAPYWISYKDIAEFCDASVKVVPWVSDKTFFPDLTALEDALSPRTKWLVLNSPNNPTGSVYDLQTLEAIASIIRKHPEVWILSDEIYEHIALEERTNLTFSKVAPDLADRTLIVNGFSKGYCMTGWRVGYGAASEELIRQMSKVQSQSTTNACTISQYAALAALKGDQTFISEHNQAYTRLRDLARSLLGTSDLLSLNKPDGGFYLLLNVKTALDKGTGPNAVEDDVALCRYMIEKSGVALVPGTAFGAPGFVRLSYACDEDVLREGCVRILDALSSLP